MLARSWPSHALTLPRWQAHRGDTTSGLTENSKKAFASAAHHGVTMVECDVRLSRDQQLVLSHDPSLQRLSGNPALVADLDHQQLASLGVDTLESALLDQPQLLFNVEIKGDQEHWDLAVDRLLELIRRHQWQSRIVVSSFYPMIVRRLLKADAGVPIALLVQNRPMLNQMALSPWLRPHLLHLPYELVSRPLLKLLHGLGFRVAIWTVNDLDLAERFLSWGADSIISDKLPRTLNRNPSPSLRVDRQNG